jgi:O-antigen/teichoic acid export membrane protein
LGGRLGGKLQRDVLWNIAGLGVMGAAGIVLNVVILALYDAATLGVFNQTFAAYIFFSQFAAGGVHFSALRYGAERARRPATFRAVGRSAVVVTCVLALIATALFLSLRGPVAAVLDSPGVGVGMGWAAAGLFLFAVNKVLLALVNAQRRMKLYAVLQAARPLVMVAALIGLWLGGSPGAMLPAVFSIAELALSIVLTACLPGLWRLKSGLRLRILAHWIGVHLHFGLRSFLSGVLVELNTRVDVLMLGYFSTDVVVGLYSFAAMLAEGFFQLLVVLRSNFNPILVTLLARRRLQPRLPHTKGAPLRLGPEHEGELAGFIRRGKLWTYALFVPVAAIAAACYPLGLIVLEAFGVNGVLWESWPVFVILMAGVAASAGYLPFGNILLQAGRPGLHTWMVLLAVAFNIGGNLVLVPVLLATGAALATSASFIFTAVLIYALARRAIGVRI